MQNRLKLYIKHLQKTFITIRMVGLQFKSDWLICFKKPPITTAFFDKILLVENVWKLLCQNQMIYRFLASNHIFIIFQIKKIDSIIEFLWLSSKFWLLNIVTSLSLDMPTAKFYRILFFVFKHWSFALCLYLLSVSS